MKYGKSDLIRPNTLAFRGKRENQSKAGGFVNQVASVEIWFCQNLVLSFMVRLELVNKFPTSVISEGEHCGVVHAYVDQKFVKSNKLGVLIEDQNIGSRHCSTEYKHNTATTPQYCILSV
jgi:hypothetical protein